MKMRFVVVVTCLAFACFAQGEITLDEVDPSRPDPRTDSICLASAPVEAGVLKVKPTYACVGYRFGATDEIADLSVECREKGGEWKKGFAPVWFKDVSNYRGSVLGLKEGTDYELRLVAKGKPVASASFRTWTTEVKVARTVEIVAKGAKCPIRITERGTPDGWVRYVVKGGPLLNDSTSSTIVFDGAAYVLLEGAVLRWGWRNPPVVIAGSHDIRIRNCEISQWGIVGKARYDVGGTIWGGDWDARRKRYPFHNHAAAIEVKGGSADVTIERCWIHDPNSRANSWRYYHPYGPSAVALHRPDQGVVIRYNDFVGSVNHWWNDAVTCVYNSEPRAGFNRDGDLDGNFVVFSNDDGVEFDGGAQNVRAFGNRFEACLMGLSLQFSAVSPAYAVDNAFTGLDTEHGLAAASIKLNSFDAVERQRAGFIADNVFARPEDPPYLLKQARNIGKPRLFISDNRVAKDTVLPTEDYPKRPVPYRLDCGRIDGVRVAKGVAKPATATVTLTCGGSGYEQPFRIAKGDDAKWFDVTPSEGVVRSGSKVVFKVAFDAERMSKEHFPKSAFLVRTADGFSRPVTVYAETDHETPVRCEKKGEIALYGKVGSKFTVDIPKEGTYYLHLRGRMTSGQAGRTQVVRTGVRVGRVVTVRDPSRFAFYPNFDTWAIEDCNEGCPHGYALKPGPCEVFVEAPADDKAVVGEVVLTDSPGSFDPMVGTPGRVAE